MRRVGQKARESERSKGEGVLELWKGETERQRVRETDHHAKIQLGEREESGSERGSERGSE